MTNTNQSLTVYQNQSMQMTFNVDQAGSTDAQTVTGATTGFWLLNNKGDPSTDAVLSYPSSDISLTNVDGTNDGVVVSIPASDTAGLSGSYYYEVWVKDTSSDVAPVATGKLMVESASGSL